MGRASFRSLSNKVNTIQTFCSCSNIRLKLKVAVGGEEIRESGKAADLDLIFILVQDEGLTTPSVGVSWSLWLLQHLCTTHISTCHHILLLMTEPMLRPL